MMRIAFGTIVAGFMFRQPDVRDLSQEDRVRDEAGLAGKNS
jgi:hypothetical protein